MKESSVASVDEQKGSLLSLLASHWEVAAYALLILVAASMRFWDLGARAIGYDESLHLYYSFRLAEGLGYQHNPLSHGPFQYHGIAAMFFLFGDSEFTARLPAAIFGTVLVGLPYFFRSHLGRAGALVTAVLLAFSPMMLFYSRYARNDIFMAVWTLGLIILLWRYMVEGKPRYLYLSALALAMAFATKETTFFVVGILGSYLLIVAAKDWVPWLLRRPAAAGIGADQPDDEYRYTPGIGYGYGRAQSTGPAIGVLATGGVPGSAVDPAASTGRSAGQPVPELSEELRGRSGRQRRSGRRTRRRRALDNPGRGHNQGHGDSRAGGVRGAVVLDAGRSLVEQAGLAALRCRLLQRMAAPVHHLLHQRIGCCQRNVAVPGVLDSAARR